MYRKVMLLLSLMIISIVLIFSFLTISEIRKVHYEEVKSRLIVSAGLIVGSLESGTEDLGSLKAFCLRSAQLSGGRVTLIDGEGKVLSDSEADADSMENHYYREEIQKAYQGKIGISQRYSTTLNKEMFYVAYPLKASVDGVRVVRVSLPLKSVLEIIQAEISRILMITVLGILVAVFLSRKLVLRIVKPIQKLSEASVKIAQGQYGLRILDESMNEINDLTINFNKMSEQLLKDQLEHEENTVKTQAILTSMINGIIAVDNERHVMFVNPVAEKLLGIVEDDVKGRHVLEVIRNNQLDQCMERFLMADIVEISDIEIFEPVYRILSISTNPIRSTSGEKLGFVLLFHDITEMRKLEQMRKDFVANVSHELKTPLTSIRGFVETLKDGAADNKDVRNKFLDILEIESSRLTALIDDLLLLSDIENRTGRVQYENIPVQKSVQEVLEMLNELARRKSITLTLDVEPYVEELKGNTGWFKQMVINLVDNAIKYTPESGSVHLHVECDGEQLLLSVEDTGIGIAQEDRIRLFERFYRVDKARSRAVGGTGLGLAIVKHIVLAMGGRIAVESTLSQGSKFTVFLPLNRE